MPTGFITLSEDEAILCLAALARIHDIHKPALEFHPNEDFTIKLIGKLAGPMLVGELHWAERLYQGLRFSKYPDPMNNFVELFHSDHHG